MSEEIIELSLVRKEKTVHLQDKDGSKKAYKILELNGTLRDEYMEASTRRMKWGPDGKPAGVNDIKGMGNDLLTRSLQDPDGKFVSADILNEWPSTVTKKLFEISAELSSIEMPKDDESKNA